MLSETHSLSNLSGLSYKEPSETPSNPPKFKSSYSIFSDGFCGEPLLSQHLTIDFNPVEGVDSEYVQKKCCAFWEFVESRQELRHLMVEPEKSVNSSQSTSDNTRASSTHMTLKSDEKFIKAMRTAVSMLEIVEKKGLLNRTFEAKLPQSKCSLGSREYPEKEAISVSARGSMPKKKIKACTTCCGVCKKCKQKLTDPPPSPESPRVKNLCKIMQQWDEDHPKSMAPPGHPPTLIHSIMQRNFLT